MRLRATTFAVLAALTTVLGACPSLPDSSQSDASVNDGETFIPLSVERVFESVGDPPGGERVSIFGGGFTQGTTVLFGEQQGTDVLVLEDGKLNVTVPAGAPGELVDVIVHTLDGQTQKLQDAYLYRGPLELASIAPATAPVAGGVEVTVVGESFDGNTRVLIGGRLLEGQQVVDANTISGRVPACLRSEAGPVDVIATNGFEQRVLTRGFTYERALVLDALTPISGTSEGGTIVTLTGSGLDRDMAVRFDDVPAEIVTVAPDHLSADVRTPPGRHGVADVALSRGSEVSTLTQAWFYVDPAIVSGSSLWAGHAVPPVGPAAGGNLVTVSVVGLSGSGGVSATVGGAPADVVEVQAGRDFVVVRAPALDGHAPAQAPIVISQSGRVAPAVPYAYETDLSVAAFDPPFLGTDGGRTTISGSGLKGSAVVTIGGKAATVASSDGGKLAVNAPGGAPGKVDVEVVVDGRRVFIPGGFEYRSGKARIWGVNPGEGAQAGGRIMRIFGEGFEANTPAPRFGENKAEDVELIDDRLVIVRLPRGEVGNVNVAADGFGTLAMALRYFDPTTRYTSTSGGTIPEALNVTVVDYFNGDPVPNAFVILWDDLETPFQGLTDDRGQITFSDIAFGPNQMVTAGADEYTTGTICDFDARDATLRLIPLNPSNPGGGGGGGGVGPDPLPDSILEGRVTGIDKYIITPPGDCQARLDRNEAPGVLCQPCTQDADCGGDGSRCTTLGSQGGRCSTACSTNADCPNHYMCVGVGGGAVQCIPDAGTRSARCQTTVADIFTGQTVALTPTDSDNDYSLQMQPGDYAVVCIGGYEDTVSHEFVATAMGVRRHVFASPGVTVDGQDINLDIPLSRDLRIRLDGAPVGHIETERHTLQVFIDLGSDGVFQMPQIGEGLDQNVFDLKGFPVEFSDSLYDATFEVYARAIPNMADELQNGEGSFVNYTGIGKIFDDAVFELDFDHPIEGSSAHHTRTGIRDDIYAMHGPAANGELPRRLFAVGSAGHVIAFDGTLWGLQQTPTQNTLRGVWAAADDDVWAVGERSTVLRWDGLVWLPVPMPAELTSALLDWWGVTGDGTGTLWLWGTHGVWRRAPDGTLTKIGSELTPGSVEDIHVVSPDEAWLVGKGGLIRRWRASVPTQLERWDRAGEDLHAVHGAAGDRVWAVGEKGRMLRWDGEVWFELLPITSRGLWDVFAVDADEAWIAADAGEVLGWDGDRWTLRETIPHSDLRVIAMTASDKLVAAGFATLIIGPFMQIPEAVNPTATGALTDLNVRYRVDEGFDASFTNMTMLHSSRFPFWDIMADGRRTNVPLPDLEKAWGLQPIWPGDGFFDVYRVYVPGFDMGKWDESILSVYRWRSWAAREFPLSIPDEAR